MDDKKKKRLEAAGFTVASVKEFLNLTDKEMAEVKRRAKSKN